MKIDLLKYFVVLTLFLSNLNLYGQTFEVNPTIQLKGKLKSNKLWLRWVMYDQAAWLQGISNGYTLKKYRVLGDNKTVEWVKKIRPVSKPDWPPSADSLTDIEGLYQLIYYSDQELIAELPKKLNGENFEYSKEEIKALRHIQCHLAANNSFQAAILQGIAYEDLELLNGAVYEYTLLTSKDSVSLRFDPKTTVTATLPPRMEYKLDEINLEFNWDGKERFDTYHGYVAEISLDGNNFVASTSGVLSNYSENALGENFREQFYWRDSVNPGSEAWYRLRGVDYFGEINNPGPILRIHQPIRIPNPVILDYQVLNRQAIINWYYEPKFEKELSHFQIWVSDSIGGAQKMVQDNIHRSQRSFQVDLDHTTKYYFIRLIRSEGNISMGSFPIMVVPQDATPPAAPRWESAICDSTGQVSLNWFKNSEVDLHGYRVFRSNNLLDEFGQITLNTVPDSFHIDSISLDNLSPYIYYKIAAEDISGNLSVLSSVIKVARYDTIPPSPPQFYQWIPTEKSIELHWYPSSSIDVSSTALLRKPLHSDEWTEIKLIEASDTMNVHIDENLIQDSFYIYSLVCYDHAGNKSQLAEPITARSLAISRYPRMEDIRSKYDSTSNAIIFNWSYTPGPIAEFWIYRTHSASPITLLTTIEGVTRSWADYDIKKGTTYIYRIKALMQNGRDSFLSRPIVVETR